MTRTISRRTLLAGMSLAATIPALHAQTAPWDVVVIGAGISGLRAATAAHEAGARRILILEKGPLVGGHALFASGTLAAVAPWRSHEDAGFVDSDDLFVHDAMEIGGNAGDPRRLRAIAQGSAYELDWLESQGVFLGEPFTAVAGRRPRCFTMPGNTAGRSYAIAAAQAVARFDIPVRLNMRVVDLSREADEWIVTASPQLINAPISEKFRTRTIIIATGGFTANVPLRCLYDRRLTVDIHTTANPQGTVWDGADGDGLALAKKVGAAITSGGGVQTIPYWGGRLLDYAGADIYLNDEGERFIDETRPWADVTDAILALPSRHCWVVTDARSFKGATLGLKLINGIVKKSDSIWQMAQGMNLSEAVLARTLERYNEAVINGRDELTGKTQFAQTIERPPYYWGRETIYVHTTLDGINTDEHSRVLTPDGRPIAGLYASGETVGGIFGRERMSGGSLINCLVMGRIAGEGAARFARRA